MLLLLTVYEVEMGVGSGGEVPGYYVDSVFFQSSRPS